MDSAFTKQEKTAESIPTVLWKAADQYKLFCDHGMPTASGYWPVGSWYGCVGQRISCRLTTASDGLGLALLPKIRGSSSSTSRC